MFQKIQITSPQSCPCAIVRLLGMYIGMKAIAETGFISNQPILNMTGNQRIWQP